MSHEDIDKTVRGYMVVFGVLIVMTVITVAVSYLDLAPGPAIALALVIASIKGALVVLYFMHLIDERKLIYAVMAVAVLFFFFELAIPAITEGDNIGLAHYLFSGMGGGEAAAEHGGAH